MSVLESRDYQAAREWIKGNPIIAMMAAGVVTVPLAELAHEDGTPRSGFMSQTNRAFDDAEASVTKQPGLPAAPAGRAPAPRADRRGRPGRARGDPRGGRLCLGSARHRPGGGDPDHRAVASGQVTRGDPRPDGSYRRARPAHAAQPRVGGGATCGEPGQRDHRWVRTTPWACRGHGGNGQGTRRGRDGKRGCPARRPHRHLPAPP